MRVKEPQTIFRCFSEQDRALATALVVKKGKHLFVERFFGCTRSRTIRDQTLKLYLQNVILAFFLMSKYSHKINGTVHYSLKISD